jgi:pyruvate/2-oxoacid:ferredoxin oxidoreductase beta subunit
MTKTIKMEDILARTERNTVLYIGYDNEAFMNTGIQESGTTPFGASTTTGPGGKKIKGKIGVKEDYLPGFTLLGHKSGFFATANVAYPLDFMGKVMDAMKTEGGGFIQVLAPCPRGWRHEGNESLKVAKLATESGYWPLITVKVKNGQPTYSYTTVPGMKKEEGKYIVTDEEKVMGLIKAQGKFRHLLKPEFLEKNIDEILTQVKARNANLNNLIKAMGGEDPEIRYIVSPMKVPNQKHINPGHGLCPGCGAGMMLNQLTSASYAVAKENCIYVNNTCCVEVATSKDDVISWQASWMHQLFESGATVADAISTAYRIMKNKGLQQDVPYVIHMGGDGSTVNIGYQFLKSAIVRASGYQILNQDLKI